MCPRTTTLGSICLSSFVKSSILTTSFRTPFRTSLKLDKNASCLARRAQTGSQKAGRTEVEQLGLGLDGWRRNRKKKIGKRDPNRAHMDAGRKRRHARVPGAPVLRRNSGPSRLENCSTDVWSQVLELLCVEDWARLLCVSKSLSQRLTAAVQVDLRIVSGCSSDDDSKSPITVPPMSFIALWRRVHKLHLLEGKVRPGLRVSVPLRANKRTPSIDRRDRQFKVRLVRSLSELPCVRTVKCLSVSLKGLNKWYPRGVLPAFRELRHLWWFCSGPPSPVALEEAFKLPHLESMHLLSTPKMNDYWQDGAGPSVGPEESGVRLPLPPASLKVLGIHKLCIEPLSLNRLVASAPRLRCLTLDTEFDGIDWRVLGAALARLRDLRRLGLFRIPKLAIRDLTKHLDGFQGPTRQNSVSSTGRGGFQTVEELILCHHVGWAAADHKAIERLITACTSLRGLSLDYPDWHSECLSLCNSTCCELDFSGAGAAGDGLRLDFPQCRRAAIIAQISDIQIRSRCLRELRVSSRNLSGEALVSGIRDCASLELLRTEFVAIDKAVVWSLLWGGLGGAKFRPGEKGDETRPIKGLPRFPHLRSVDIKWCKGDIKREWLTGWDAAFQGWDNSCGSAPPQITELRNPREDEEFDPEKHSFDIIDIPLTTSVAPRVRRALTLEGVKIDDETFVAMLRPLVRADRLEVLSVRASPLKSSKAELATALGRPDGAWFFKEKQSYSWDVLSW